MQDRQSEVEARRAGKQLATMMRLKGELQMERRIFIGATAGLALLPKLGLARPSAEHLADEAADILLERLLPNGQKRRSAAALGRACLEEKGCLPTTGQLVDDLARSLGTSAASLGDLNPTELRARFRARSADDFKAARTVRIQGWILGETETTLFTLASRRSDERIGLT